MARWPAPGRCKRRLAVELGGVRAAGIQARLARHTLAVAAARNGLADAGSELVLAVSGLGARAARRWGRQLGAERVLLQGPGGLGLRLARQLIWAQRAGVGRLVLIGSDLPELSAADLEAAFQALARVPLVYGPACDGGYWLIGLRLTDGGLLPLQRRLLAGDQRTIPWGGPAVLAASLAVAERAGLAMELLAERADLDRPGDLRRWREPCWS
jgi:rSAM/selenodomain-associated transferase 1